tara:strand:- start:14 stop:7042 length:7029 start_codon:yes stop_codon:yes gene_type:complete
MANSLVKSLSEAEQYVNTINPKLSCKVATTANITLSGTQTIDGISISENERVLVKDQSTGSENGIYICSSGGWFRSTDMDSNETCRPNSFVFIEQGSTNADKMFQLTTDRDIVIDTTSLTFEEYGGSSGGGVTSITSGDGINGTGTTGDITLSLDVDDTTIEINASGEASAKTASVTNGATTLATGDQIYDYVTTNTVLLTTNQTVVGSKTFSDSMIINDNLTINSSTTTINSDDLIIKDPLIKIADGNSTDNVDIGFYGEYNSKYSGLIRNSTDEEWYLFKDSTDNPPDSSNLEPANLNSNLDGGVVIKVTAKVNLVKGNAVYIHSDTDNDTTYVDKADASDTSKMPSFGLVLKNINANNSGFVVTLGNIINISTTDIVETGITLSDGDVCYISGSESGKITNVPPSGESNRIQNIGKVIRLHNGNLTLRVGGAGRTNATPALNNGNIFMGDSNNNSVSKSFNTALTDENVVFTTSSQTLTNKTLTSAVLNTGVSGTAILDEDNMSSNSNTQLATQQSIKAYADTKQPLDAELTALAGLTSAANKIPMFNGSESATTIDFKDEDDMSSNSATAVASQQSVKAYVDTIKQGLHIKEACRVATTVSGTLSSSFENGDTIDGVSLSTGDRILIKDQSTATENGIYVVKASGSPDRSSDMTVGDTASGDFTFVTEGTVNGDHGFVCTSNSGSDTIGTDNLSFTQFSGAGQITAGNGLEKSGNTLSIDAKSNSGIVIDSTELSLDLGASSITGTLSVSDGGTGATTAAAARTALDVDQSGTDNSTDVTLATVTGNYLSISGQEITAGNVPISLGGTGATTLNNLITLGDHTTGNYVSSLTAGNLIDLQNNTGEGATPTIDVDLSEATEASIAHGDYILFLDGGSTGTAAKESLSDLVTLFAGSGLTTTNSVLNVIGGDGITENANDIAITETQTTITSIKNSSLEIGRDDDNQIKFSTDNQIIFEVDGGDNVIFKGSGEIEASSLDISGDADIDGTLEADAITIGGNSLSSVIQGTTVNNSTTAAVATTVTITDNENTDEDNAIIFAAGGDVDGGNLGLESDGNLTYNPSTGKITATGFIGALTGNVTGDVTGNAGTVTNGVYTTNNLSVFSATTSSELRGVISDETGSGSLVFATSPTLVTPALGTPASGVLTNCTGTASGLTAGKVTVTDSTANTDFPIVFHNESNALLDDTGSFIYNPSSGTLSSSNSTISDLSTINRVEYTNSNVMKFNQYYQGNSSGSYFENNEYQKILTITPSGNTENYHIQCRISANSAQHFHHVYINAGLRSNTLPVLDWNIYYDEEYNNHRYIDPLLWTKETTTAGFILAFKALRTIYGNVTCDITVIPRFTILKSNISINSTSSSEQTSIDSGFTSNDMTKVLSKNGSELSLTGPLTVGVDDTGHDVKFFGATTGAYMLWDESEDDLIVRRGQLKVLNNSDVVNFLVNTNGNVTLGGDLSVGDDIQLTSDSSIIKFGANDEITLTHVHNSGLTLTNTITTDNTPVVFQLKSEEDAITANEVIGSLEFAAGDSDGTDGATVAAGIHAIAENTFTASANPTKLVFTTGVSETAAASATAKMTLSSAGVLTTGQISVGGNIIPTADVTYDLGNASYQFRDLYLSGSTIHLGSTSLKTDSNGDIEFVDKSNNNTRRKLVADEIILGTGANRLVLKKNSSTNRLEMKNNDDNSAVTMDGFILEDGDGTEVRITDNKEIKFVEGTGIDINWTDTSNGSDSDPYDLTFTCNLEGTELKSTGETGGSKFLRENGDGTCSWQTISTGTTYSAGNGIDLNGTTFSVAGGDGLTQESLGLKITPAQTTITSVYNSSLKIGTATNQEYINFGTSNEVNTFVNDTEILSVTSSGVDITGTIKGDTSLTLDSTTITTAEIGVLNGVTAGTAAGSKALVLDANKDIGTIRNLTINGTFSDGNYTFDTNGNVSGLGTIGCGVVTASGFTTTGTWTFDSSAGGGATVGIQVVQPSTTVFADSNVTLMTAAAIQDKIGSYAGNGLTLNSNQFEVAASQTNITSLLATDIKIGEDDQTKIDFEDTNKINFYANNEKQLILEDGALYPGSDNIIDLGKSDNEFKNAYFDGTVTSDAFSGPLNGNATTATALETPRTIHGISFDGSENIDLSEVIQDTVGAMFTYNTETGITATYQDSDGTIDLVIGSNSITNDMLAGSISSNKLDDNIKQLCVGYKSEPSYGHVNYTFTTTATTLITVSSFTVPQGFTKIKGRIQTGILSGYTSTVIYCRFKFTRLSGSSGAASGYLGNCDRLWMAHLTSYSGGWDRHRNIIESLETTLVAGQSYKVEGQFWRLGGTHYTMYYGPGTSSVDWPPLVMEILAGRDDT